MEHESPKDDDAPKTGHTVHNVAQGSFEGAVIQVGMVSGEIQLQPRPDPDDSPERDLGAG